MAKRDKDDAGERYLSTAEVAKKMSCSIEYVRILCRDGRLKCIRFNGRWKIPESALPQKEEPKE